jgi:ABC-type transport system substrate-binding protein
MRLIVFRLLAAISLAAFLCTAATRPHYGGVLRVQILDALPSLDPGEPNRDRVVSLVAETLVDLDGRGVPQPRLAVAWQHDYEAKRWWFTLRPRVTFHDGSAFQASAAAAALSTSVKTITAIPNGMVLELDSPTPRPGLLEELANPRNSIFKRTAENPLVGTGPFRLNAWSAGAPVMLTANEEHWAGRPFLDAVHFDTRHAATPDIVELPVNTNARMLSDRLHIVTSSTAELIVLVLPASIPPELREALSMSIDRMSIVNVLLQKRGEPTAALLPQWLSGYEFLFPKDFDQNRARQLAGVSRPPVTVSYPSGDFLLRNIADRIALNTRDAGMMIQTTAGTGQARLVRMPITSTDPLQSLAEISAACGAVEPGTNLYDSERALIESARLIPIAHIPRVYGIHSRVRNWEMTGVGMWRLENVWIAP